MKAAIVGLAGTELSPDERSLLRAEQPAGVILFARNVAGKAELARLTGDIRAALPPGGVLMVDQEGGRVARLRPPHWPAHPAAALIGARYARDRQAGARLAWITGALIGLDCLEAGFDVVCAPVLDLATDGMTAAIGDRSFGAEVEQVAMLGQAAAAGLMSAGVQPVGKHAPGHGRARVDSHVGLPRLEAEEDLSPDIAVFARCRALPWMMTAHIVYAGVDADRPGTLSPAVIGDVIRERIGFGGVLVSDDLSMGAVSGAPGFSTRQALEAGCDLALHCSGAFEESRAVLAAAGEVSAAAAGRLTRARESAARARVTLDRAGLAAEQAALLA